MAIPFFVDSPAVLAQEDASVREPLDPQCRAFLDSLAKQAGPGWGEMGIDQARTTFNSLTDLFGTGPADVRSKDLRLVDRVPVRLYLPASNSSTAKLPVIMYFHGGGWVLGNLDTHDALCRRLCKQANCALVAVDYRLAPENLYPAAFDDCYMATEFISLHGDELGLDGDRLVVAGDSAGGTLAVAVALKARNVAGPKILGQILLYPVLDSRCDSTSYESFASGYGLSRADMQWFWQQYMGQHHLGNRRADGYAVPANAGSLEGLPATTVITAGFDVLRDEAELFAAKLKQAKVPVKLRHYGGMIHGFVHFAGAFDRGLEATTDIAADIAEYVQLQH